MSYLLEVTILGLVAFSTVYAVSSVLAELWPAVVLEVSKASRGLKAWCYYCKTRSFSQLPCCRQIIVAFACCDCCWRKALVRASNSALRGRRKAKGGNSPVPQSAAVAAAAAELSTGKRRLSFASVSMLMVQARSGTFRGTKLEQLRRRNRRTLDIELMAFKSVAGLRGVECELYILSNHDAIQFKFYNLKSGMCFC